MCCFCTFLILLGVAWFCLLYWLLDTTINKQLKYTEHRDPNLKEEYKPFERRDRKNWKFYQFLICGFFLIPIRIPIILIWVSIPNIFGKFKGVIEKDNHNKIYDDKTLSICRKIFAWAGYWIHFGAGFQYIQTIKKDIKDFDPTYKVPQNIKDYKDKAPISISNHVSWVDIMNLVSYCVPSFLSKSDVAKYPLYGGCTTALQSIYLTRESNENRNLVSKLIQERCELIKQGKNIQSLHIFPEGTTSNGYYLISFKKGAFEPKVPVRIICLKYFENNFHPSIDIGQLQAVILQLCQWRNTCVRYDLGIYYPEGNVDFKGDENDWELYARKVKNIMLKCLELENSEAGFRHMKEFQQINKEKNKQLLKQARESKKSK